MARPVWPNEQEGRPDPLNEKVDGSTQHIGRAESTPGQTAHQVYLSEDLNTPHPAVRQDRPKHTETFFRQKPTDVVDMVQLSGCAPKCHATFALCRTWPSNTVGFVYREGPASHVDRDCALAHPYGNDSSTSLCLSIPRSVSCSFDTTSLLVYSQGVLNPSRLSPRRPPCGSPCWAACAVRPPAASRRTP